MPTTFSVSTTRSSTRDSLHQTGNIPPLLVSPIAELGGEGGAGGTLGLTVAVVSHRVATRMLSPAQFSALWWPGTTWHRGEGDSSSTVAGKLCEADIVAGVAVPLVTGSLTPVQTTGEHSATQQGAGVLHLDTAQLSTLVLPTLSLLLTSFATPCIVSTGGQLHAGHLLVHVAAPALDTGGAGAWWTRTRVTRMCTPMRRGGGATSKSFITCLLTQGDWILARGPGTYATLAVQLLYGDLPTGTVFDHVYRELTWRTGSLMARLRTGVIPT